MSRAVAARPPTCEEHPHRGAVDHCDECRRRFCRHCLVRGKPQLLCRACWAAAPERERLRARRRHPVHGRLDWVREHRASALAAGVIVGVLALLGASGAAQVLSPASRSQIGEAVIAVRRGAPLPSGQAGTPGPGGASGPGTGTMPAPPRVPTLMGSLFGSASTIAESVPGVDPGALVDGQVGSDAPAWRSPVGFPAPELRLRARDDVAADRLLFAHSTAAPSETWARDVEVWIALTADGSDAVRLGQWTLDAVVEPQEFPFPPAQVTWVRVRVLSNYGGADSSSLAEVALLPVASRPR